MGIAETKAAIKAKWIELFRAFGGTPVDAYVDKLAEAIAYGVVTTMGSGSGSGMIIHDVQYHKTPVGPHSYLTSVNPWDHHTHVEPVVKSDWTAGQMTWDLGYEPKVLGPIEYMIAGGAAFIPLDPATDYSYSSGVITFSFEPGSGSKVKLCGVVR